MSEQTKLTEENKRLREALVKIVVMADKIGTHGPAYDFGSRQCFYCGGTWLGGGDQSHEDNCPLATARRMVGFYAPVKEEAE
jgi:hypothetical protein